MNGSANTRGNWAVWKYHVRGHARNVVKTGDQITFELDPIWPHVVDFKMDETTMPFLLLIGSRLSKSEKCMISEDDCFIISKSAKFITSDSGKPSQDGDRVECYILENEANRIKASTANSCLLIHVDEVYSC